MKKVKIFSIFFVCCLYCVVFWIFASLTETSITLFVKNNLARVIWGREIPAGSVISIWYAAMLITIFILKKFKGGNNLLKNLRWGMNLTILSYTSVVIAATLFDVNSLMPFTVIIIFYILLGGAEVLVQPTGNAAAGDLMPKKYRGISLGIWQFSSGLGVELSFHLAKITSPAVNIKLISSNIIYRESFLVYVVLCIFMAVLLFFISQISFGKNQIY
ncbi:POT-type proton-dependent oligopeptide transporter, partial [Piscirickettsia litoralis]|uniref:POT-type proton-dependent oligopeptide transporter n=1 Tax=Piscirickettsia litoralis TaxID=1891921 RepID=UPI0013012821